MNKTATESPPQNGQQPRPHPPTQVDDCQTRKGTNNNTIRQGTNKYKHTQWELQQAMNKTATESPPQNGQQPRPHPPAPGR